MKFILVDQVLEQAADRIVTLKHVSLAEEYLADHFPTYPVLPGVLMVEAMVQAARRMLRDREPRLVLGEAKAIKFGSFVRPGESLRIEVSLTRPVEEGGYLCQGSGRVIRPAGGGPAGGSAIPPGDAAAAGHDSSRETAVAGRFIMRPIRP
jgi:3-hydroxyacyl-[acyl-carrier-protein] dehydratase